jgi:fatty-acid desaturase
LQRDDPNLVEAVNESRVSEEAPREEEVNIIVAFGLILLIIGYVLAVKILWSIGVILLLIGLVFWVLGALGHAVGGRKHYF